MTICGIDPGLSGGIAFINRSAVIAEKVPVLTLKTANKTRRYLNVWDILKTIKKHNPSHVYIEKQQPMPKQGVTSTFSTGFGYGVYIGLLVSLNIPYTEVAPIKWKRDMGVTSDKDMARKRASELMPQGAPLWTKKSDDGIAEAAMIALWGSKQTI